MVTKLKLFFIIWHFDWTYGFVRIGVIYLPLGGLVVRVSDCDPAIKIKK